MAWSLIASGAGGGAAGVNIGDTTGADLIVVMIYRFGGTTAFSDSEGNTWTPLTEEGTGGYFGGLLYCVSPNVGDNHTFTNDGTNATFSGVAVMAFSGLDTGDPFGGESAGNANSGTTIQPGSLTPDADFSLVVTGLGTDPGSDGGTADVDSGFTDVFVARVGGTNVGAGLAYLFQDTAAAVNPTWTITSGTNAATSAYFHGTGGGGGGGDGGNTSDCAAQFYNNLLNPARF